jgi:hypothetical protein
MLYGEYDSVNSDPGALSSAEENATLIAALFASDNFIGGLYLPVASHLMTLFRR